tara:strand:+ start:13362 stop:13655 length:294 start_codon:yes stop_codon:yes gene_type:complete
MKIKVLDTELKVGNIRRKINSVNILSFKYSFFCEGAYITCQIYDDKNCICFEECIFIKKEILKDLGNNDQAIINELLIRLGLKEYNTNEQGDKKIKK